LIGIPGKFERDLTEIDRLQDPDHSKCFAADNAIRRRSYPCLADDRQDDGADRGLPPGLSRHGHGRRDREKGRLGGRMSFDKNLRFTAADKIERRAEWIRAFNAEAVARPDAWIISTPNAALCMIEVLATSGWPAELVKSYPLKEIEDGQRILPYDVDTPMEIAPDGPLIPATANSTRPVTMVNYSAGIIIQKTRRFSFWRRDSEPLGPWASYANALTFLRPRPPSIGLAPQFRIAVFRKSCPHAESDRIVPQPAAFAAGRRLAFRSCAGDHVRSPPRAAYPRCDPCSESSLHRVPLFKQTYIRSEADIRSISPSS